MALPSKLFGPSAGQRLARQVARAAGTFEHRFMGGDPTNVTVVAGGDPGGEWMVVSVQTTLAPLDRVVAAECRERAAEIQRRQRAVFHRALPAVRDYVRRLTGVDLRGGMVGIDVATGGVVKTFATHPELELFLLGTGLPLLGVPIDAHVHADGPHVLEAAGSHAVGMPHTVRREPSVMTHV